MRILLVRTSALGDVVHCLPVLTALRRHLPQARIGWVIEEAMAPLLAGHPDLDELLVVRLRTWRRRPLAPSTLREVAAFFTALERFAPEIALDLMGNHKGGLLAALTLADHRIGLARRHRREPGSAVWISRGVEPRGPHAVDRALSLLAALGLPPEPAEFGSEKLFRPPLPAPGTTAPAPREASPADAPARDFVLIHPGAAWGNKVYPPERWGEVARLLAARGLPVRVAEAPGEEGLAAAVVEASAGAAEPVAAPDLPTLARHLRAARLVLAADTGPLHLAHALGAPVLAVMGPTDPATHGPYNAPERALAVRLPCSFCHKRMEAPRACLLAISPTQVAERALELLG
jgi:heptosyltransferase-1